MKKVAPLILVLIFLSGLGRAQSINFFSSTELSFSANYTDVADNNTSSRPGWGLGLCTSLMPGKRLDVLMGVEFNQSAQFKNQLHLGHVAYTTNINYLMRCFSIPVYLRYYSGSKLKFFAESGLYLDLIAQTRQSGVAHVFLPNEQKKIVYQNIRFDENTDLAQLNYGPSFGAGFSVPLAASDLLLKVDYKLGLHRIHHSGEEFTNSYVRLTMGFRI